MKSLVTILVAAFGLPFFISSLGAQGTAFTYQGRLSANGGLASGSYDFRFRLATDALGNNYVGNAFLTNALPVSNGLFTAIIDFGASLFAGTNYWLEVDVRTNGPGGYTALNPLQAITPTPYAIMAGSASNLLGALPAAQLSGAIANGNLPASPTFSGTVTATVLAGNGANVTNVNAASLNGLNASNFWKTGGNAGTTAGVNFVGTTDNQPLELRVNSQRGLRLEPGGSNSVNVVGGYAANGVAAGLVGATVGGGGAGNYFGAASTNRADANFATVAGGSGNVIQRNSTGGTVGGGTANLIQSNATAAFIGGGSANIIGPSALQATIGGGGENAVNSLQGTIGGGYLNSLGGTNFLSYNPFINFGQLQTIGGGGANVIGGGNLAATIAGGLNNRIYPGSLHSTIGGGQNNIITNAFSASWATISGGERNVALDDYATIPGGEFNAAGQLSFAAGFRAKAKNQGTFVWADSQNADFTSTANNQFLVRAAGGVGINTTNPAATLDVNGTMRVGTGATVFANLQAGLVTMPTDSTTVKTNFTFSFPKAFGSVPKVLVSARSAQDVDDTFTVTVRRVTTTTCTVNVVRTDLATGWSQHMQVTWMAWE